MVVEFPDRPTAHAAGPALLHTAFVPAEQGGLVESWWFVRKGSAWRARYRPRSADTTGYLAYVLDRAHAGGQIAGWAHGVYEPETDAFGGPDGIDTAHRLFHAHARATVTQCPPGSGAAGLGPRELAVLLPSVLMRGAGLDRFEQGDVWARVARERSTDHPTFVGDAVASRLRRLMTAEVGPTSALRHGALAPTAGWVDAFDSAGHRLADLARCGALERGLRAVLAHHVIFTWNILGIATEDQSTLSTLARGNVMGTGNSDPATAERLRGQLVDQLRERGAVQSDRVDGAVRSVPRHVFVRQFRPAVTIEEAYADDPVPTKFDAAGIAISAVSQPTVNALMLELTDARPGMRVKEAGAGSGLFAAYLGHLVGPDGHVYTFDVDDDLIEGAHAALTAAGVTNVTAILGDGSGAHPDGAPYDRIVATVGAYGIPAAWLDQLAPAGRLVVPLRIRGSVSRAIAFEQDTAGRWRSTRSEMCTFMPLRGVAQDPRRLVTLGPDAAVTLQVNQDQAVDAQALAGVFDQPRTEAWTGVTFRGAESHEWLDLYLACALDNALSRMTTTDEALASGLVMPRFGRVSMATVEKANLAYLTLRRSVPSDDGGSRFEVGVAGHGPGGDELAGRVADAVRTWDRKFRTRPVAFEILGHDAPPVEARPGRYTVATPLNRLAVEWE